MCMSKQTFKYMVALMKFERGLGNKKVCITCSEGVHAKFPDL